MKFEYDIPEEVTEKQFNALMSKCGGVVCGKKEDGKYFIKLWLTKYRSYLQQLVQSIT